MPAPHVVQFPYVKIKSLSFLSDISSKKQWHEREQAGARTTQMAHLEAEKIDQIQWQALGAQASRFTYCLVDRTTQETGTAIAIQLAKRFFFATARHVIEQNHDIEIHPRGNSTTPVATFAARHYDNQLDIALLELTAEGARRFDFADNSRLLRTIDTNTELPTLVVGYPSQFFRSAEIRLTDECSLRLVGCSAFTCRSVVLPQSEWPDGRSLQEPLVAGRDLLVDFSPQPQIRVLPPGVLLPEVSAVDCHKVDPHGLSGGGIWLAHVEDRNGLWISDVRLIGIQTGWYERNGWLRGVRIDAWLNMVRAEYPNLIEDA